MQGLRFLRNGPKVRGCGLSHTCGDCGFRATIGGELLLRFSAFFFHTPKHDNESLYFHRRRKLAPHHLPFVRRSAQSAKRSFVRRDYLPRQAEWERFFGYLAKESKIPEIHAHFSRAYWYVVNAVEPSRGFPKRSGVRKICAIGTSETKKESGILSISSTTAQPTIRRKCPPNSTAPKRSSRNCEKRFAGFAVIQKGITRAHGQIEFRRSGGIGYDLFTKQLNREKTTDVNLAVDMMRLKDIYDIAVIVSGDQDFVPAAAAVKDLGKKVVNVSFRQKNGLLPSGASRSTRSRMRAWKWITAFSTNSCFPTKSKVAARFPALAAPAAFC